jgi:dTDP-glucose 4,6-dehydratase
MTDTIVVTGGAGFIGSNFVRLVLRRTGAAVAVIDKLTYAGSRLSLADVEKDPSFTFIEADIADAAAMKAAFERLKPRAVINFAAETHVDRSIDGPAAFVTTNLVGTFVLLEQARAQFAAASEADKKAFRFIQVSTDEVYGSLGKTGLFTEDTPYAPNSPYSASKAGADHLARAYFHTYGLPVIITNCSNNYGPYQFPEKLIPLMILNAAEAKPLPIYGDGGNVRDWLYVEDHCEAILTALEKGRPGEKYNVGSSNERTNIDIVDRLCAILEKLLPAAKNPALVAAGVKRYSDLKKFVQDRPGHDRRYAIDPAKTQRELGWSARHNFDQGLEATVRWYLDHRDWCSQVQKGRYDRGRLGLTAGGKG